MELNNVTHQEKHGTSAHQERQIQKRLLAFDDVLENEEHLEVVRNAVKIKTAKTIREKREELTGWISDPNLILRKAESQKDPVVSKGKDSTQREYLSWREARLKLVSNQRETYVFKHYQDPRYYIKQYREENTLLENATPQPPKRVSAFYNPGYSNYNVAPQQTREYSLLSRITQTSTTSTGTFQYTKSDRNNYASLIQKYKLSPTFLGRDESGSSSESEKREPRSSRDTPGNQTQTKLKVHSQTNKVSNSSLCSLPNGSVAPLEPSAINTRTLEALTCVSAQDKQVAWHPRTLDGLSWREKLEVLRQINKPALNAKQRSMRLSLYKSNANGDIIGCGDPMSHNQVSNQRRIRHLIEQTRLKLPARPLGYYDKMDVPYDRPHSTIMKGDHSPQLSYNSDKPGQLVDMETNNVDYRLKLMADIKMSPSPSNAILTFKAGSHESSTSSIGQRSLTCMHSDN